jgi:hypothetical protein
MQTIQGECASGLVFKSRSYLQTSWHPLLKRRVKKELNAVLQGLGFGMNRIGTISKPYSVVIKVLSCLLPY